MFTSVLAQVMWVLLFESRASCQWHWGTVSTFGLPLHCTCTPACLISGSWTTVGHHSFHGPAQTVSLYDLCTIVNYRWKYVCSFILYPFSEHAVFFLTNAGQFFVSMKWRSFVVAFKYLLKQWNSAVSFSITNVVSISQISY